ncbi:hypothetical protein GCM10023172_02060 [Hymenobacter ginsengisoli]|uniref:DUF3806 domain-containing protein n=1 Tax=Hymenobacter ginsengisoli TaxID=1051626 RepID=A0ABP8PW01_9BACT|nr:MULTISPECIES: hypothetical protein [unclassified Hymenobacter]MBO2030309.1 hypothetical protein [Hymenobacter sp. BT559]
MSENAPEVSALQAAAEQVRQQLGLPVYNEAAVLELDHFIEVQRAELVPGSPDREGVVTALGCFLGQCLVNTYRAEWAAGPDGSTGVGLANKLFFNPFYLVNEQLNTGEAASVAAFFRSVPQRLVRASGARKRWIS